MKSDLWIELKQEIENQGLDWREHRIQQMKSLTTRQAAQQAAKSLGLDTTGSHEEIIIRLVDNDCFGGPIQDNTVYIEEEGEAVPVIRKKGVLGHLRWKKVYNR